MALEHAGLMQAIREAPDDDTPRLVLADWLEDNGDPQRAEFIRLQVARAARESGGDPRRRTFLRLVSEGSHASRRTIAREACSADNGTPPEAITSDAREEALLAEQGNRWTEGLPLKVKFDRGMPEQVKITAWDYLRHAEALARLTPVLSVALTDYAPWDQPRLAELGYEYEEAAREGILGQVAAHPSLAGWVALEFFGCPGRDNFRRVLSSPHLTNLRRLVAVGNEVGPGVEIVAAERFASLRWLDLQNSDSADGKPGDDEFIEIVTCPHLANLEFLNFNDNRAGDEGVAALASSPAMSRLRSLSLEGNYFGRAGWEALARSTTLTNLRYLDLSRSWLNHLPGDAGLAALLAARWLTALRYLDVGSSGITDDGVALLARTPAVAGLRSLEVGGGRIRLTGAAVRALVESPHLAGLRRLTLYGVTMDDSDAALLARPDNLPALADLRLRAEDLTDESSAILRERFGNGLTLRQ